MKITDPVYKVLLDLLDKSNNNKYSNFEKMNYLLMSMSLIVNNNLDNKHPIFRDLLRTKLTDLSKSVNSQINKNK